ncbi:hypothetical protein L7F22_006523 [Adiantum nelumboides]|nr:hypothetical protein [Adiantum nelumboides]
MLSADVKRWLMLTRGASMPASFSWSYRRNYRKGCIWQDVTADEDLILPAAEDEYVLKGSKVVAASIGLWPAPGFAKLDQNSSGLHNDHDHTVRVEEEMTIEGTEALLAGNEQEADVGEESCQLTFTDTVSKSNVIYSPQSTLDDASSTFVMVKHRPPTNSDLSIPDSTQTSECACLNGKGQKTKTHCVSGSATMDASHGSCPRASTGLTFEVIHEKGVAIDSSKLDKQASNPNVAEIARLLTSVNHHKTYQTTGIHGKLTDVSYLKIAENGRFLEVGDNHTKDKTTRNERCKQSNLNVIQNATLLQTVDNKVKCQTSKEHVACGAQSDATDGVYVAVVSKNFKREPRKSAHLKTDGYGTPASSRAITCPSVEKTLDPKQPKHTKSKNILGHASSKAMNANITECEDKQIRHADKSVVVRRSIRTKWGCHYTPVRPTHVNAYNTGDVSACKQQLPTAKNVLWKITGRLALHDKKLNNERVRYSDELGVRLPGTMVIKDVAVDESEPLCPFYQRPLAKQASLCSTFTPAYSHNKDFSQYLPRNSSLPVFGSEKRQRQLIEELDLFRIESRGGDFNFARNSSKSQPLCMQQASKTLWHEGNGSSINPVVCSHDHAILSKNVARKDSKLLWEELLQTTKDVLIHQETIQQTEC